MESAQKQPSEALDETGQKLLTAVADTFPVGVIVKASVGDTMLRPAVSSLLKHITEEVTADSLAKQCTLSDGDIRYFAYNFMYHYLYNIAMPKSMADKISGLREEVATRIGKFAASAVSTSVKKPEEQGYLSSWASWMYGGFRDSLGKLANSYSGRNAINITSGLISTVAELVSISWLVNFEEKDVDFQYMATTLLYMRMTSFLALIIQKGIIEVVEKCKEYHIKKTLVEQIGVAELVDEQKFKDFIKKNIKERYPDLASNEEQIDRLVTEIAAEGIRFIASQIHSGRPDITEKPIAARSTPNVVG